MTAPDIQELVIENWVPTQISNGSARTMHWAAARKIKAADGDHVFAAVRTARWHGVTGRPRLEIQMVFPVRRKRDKDNLHSRVKALVDALKRLHMFTDDDDEHLDLQVLPPIVERGRRETRLRLIG